MLSGCFVSLSLGKNCYYTSATKIQNSQCSREPVTDSVVRARPQRELDTEHEFSTGAILYPKEAEAGILAGEKDFF